MAHRPCCLASAVNGLGPCGFAKLHAACLGGSKRHLGTLRDLGPLLFGMWSMNGSAFGISVTMNGTPSDIRPEMNATLRDRPVELGHDHRALVGRSPVQRRLQLRPPLRCINVLGGLDFGKDPSDLIAFGGTETLNCGLLAFKAETGLPLLGERNEDVGDNWLTQPNFASR